MKKYYISSAVLTIFTLVVIILGFNLVGSPFKNKLKETDSVRVSNLLTIRGNIDSYYSKHKSLPKNLNEAFSLYSTSTVPVDPETKQNYQYDIISGNSYRLCANFKTDNSFTGYNYPNSDETAKITNHGKGNLCFDLTPYSAKYSTPTPTPYKPINNTQNPRRETAGKKVQTMTGVISDVADSDNENEIYIYIKKDDQTTVDFLVDKSTLIYTATGTVYDSFFNLKNKNVKVEYVGLQNAGVNYALTIRFVN